MDSPKQPPHHRFLATHTSDPPTGNETPAFTRARSRSHTLINAAFNRPGQALALIGIKSGQTVTKQYFQAMNRFCKVVLDRIKGGLVVYDGAGHQQRSDWEAWPVKNAGGLYEKNRAFFAD